MQAHRHPEVPTEDRPDSLDCAQAILIRDDRRRDAARHILDLRGPLLKIDHFVDHRRGRRGRKGLFEEAHPQAAVRHIPGFHLRAPQARRGREGGDKRRPRDNRRRDAAFHRVLDCSLRIRRGLQGPARRFQIEGARGGGGGRGRRPPRHRRGDILVVSEGEKAKVLRPSAPERMLEGEDVGQAGGRRRVHGHSQARGRRIGKEGLGGFRRRMEEETPQA